MPPGGLLVGYRLHDDGYAPIRANAAGRLPSAALGLELVMRDGLLRFFDPAAGEYLRTLGEYAQERKSAEAAKTGKGGGGSSNRRAGGQTGGATRR